MLFINEILLVAVAGLVLWAIWRASGEKWDIQILAGPDRVEIVRGVARAHHAKIANFLRYDVALTTPITILAKRDPQGVLRMKITGKVDNELRQRIRNFLSISL